MNRTLASLLKEIAQILTDEKDEISGVFFCAVKRDGSLPEVVAQLDERGGWDASGIVGYWQLAQHIPRLSIKQLWDERERSQMNMERDLLIHELERPVVCDGYTPGGRKCLCRFKTERGLEMHKKRSPYHREKGGRSLS